MKEHKDLCILYKRLSTNVADVLVPNLCRLDESDGDIKRLLGMMSKVPSDSDIKYA